MNKIYQKIGETIEKSPFKVLFASLTVALILIAGALKVTMATGNDTLVQSDSEAFISNYEMEEEFGADAIMVLLKGSQEDLLSQENIEKMWNVEQRLKYNEDIYSLLSPASIVHQITNKQGEQIKEKLPEISDGLGEMSEKLIEIGTELGSKDLPDPAEIEDKLDDLMTNMDPDSLMGDMLQDQEAEMAKLNGDVTQMSDGLGEMGDRLIAIGSDLSSKDLPDPKEIEKKLDGLMQDMDADTLSAGMLKAQKAEIAQMNEDVAQMSGGLSQMGNQLVDIGTKLGQMQSPDISELEARLGELENVAGGFEQLIQGQNNLAVGLENVPNVPEDLKQVPVNTVTGLTGIQTKLEEQLNAMQGSLPEPIPAEELATMSAGLVEMGRELTNMSQNISNLPTEMANSLGQAPTKVLDDMMGQMEQEITGMKAGLSGGLSPEELQTMATGFTTMGEKLKEVSGGLSNLPEKMAEMTAGLENPSVLFSGMMVEIEAEVDEMKGNLTGGIDPEELTTMAEGFVTMGENLADLSEGLETFADKSGMMMPNIPHNQAELDFILYDEETGELKDIFTDTVIDDEHLMMIIKLKGNIEDTAKDQVYLEVQQAMEAEKFGQKTDEDSTKGNSLTVYAMGEEELADGEIEYLISGKPVLDASLREEMQVNMQYMVIGATIVMTLVLFFVFKVRWSILSIGIILVAVIATLGLMGHLSVSMTMVSMAVFPILIGLGIDFSIQFHNRYEEELSVTTALTQTGRAIAMAVLASMLGFISLYISPVPMIQDFGKMLTIGVVVSFLGSVFLLMPILRIRDLYNPSSKLPKSDGSSNPAVEEDDGGVIGRILTKTTNWVSHFAPLVLIIATILAGLGLYADSKVGVQTDIETFMPQDMAALEDIRYVRDVVGSTDQIVLFMEDEMILSEKNISWMQEKTEFIENEFEVEVEDVKSVDNLVTNLSEENDLSYQEYVDLVNDLPDSQRSMFINEDRTKAAMILNITHMGTEELEVFIDKLGQDLEDAPMELTITGKSVLDVEMVEGLTGGRMKMTILGISLVFLGIFLVYRNPVKALIPVLPVILIVGMSGGVMYLLGFNYTPITATLGALILGMGVETTIMVLERYIEEREGGRSKADALNVTITRIGKATLSTEFTTMGGFAVLIFSNFVILKDFGIMTVINVSLVMMSTFIVLPAVIWILDRFIIKE